MADGGENRVRPRVVIVGAGFAGLAAGALLAERGIAVTVLDARPRLGGRATAFTDRQTGELVDNGQHVMFGCYRETLAFLHRIGADANVRMQDALEVPFIGTDGRRTVLKCPPLPPPVHLLAGVLRWKALGWRDRLSALRLAPSILLARGTPGLPASAKATAWSRRSASRVGGKAGPPPYTVAEWLRQHGQSARLIEYLWEPLAVAALNQPIADAGADAFVTVLREMFSADRAAASLVLPLVPLDAMYAEPARAFIERRGGTVRTDALARVTTDGRRATGVDVRGEHLAADAVISTVPWHQLRTLFASPPAALESILANADAMDSMPIVTVNLWYDRVVMDEPFVGLVGRSMQWVFDKRRVFGEAASHLSLVSSAAASLAARTQQDLIDLAAREIAEAVPGARDAQLLRATVVREKHATFSLTPGQPPRPGTRTPLANFYLAGDWVDTGFPGTIESAVISGHRAAQAIIDSL